MTSLPDAIFRQAMDESLDLVMVLEANYEDVGGSKIVYVNSSFTRILGYAAEEVIGQSPRILQGEQTDKRTRLEIRIALKHKQPIRSKILNYTKQGEEIWLDIHLIPIQDDEGNISHFVAIERQVPPE